MPDGVDISTAGGVPLVGLTAWQSLQYAKPKAGQRILIMAASGGEHLYCDIPDDDHL